MEAAELVAKTSKYFRRRRMRRFKHTFAISSDTRILDLGGSTSTWEHSQFDAGVTILNFPTALDRSVKSVTLTAGDGRMLPFKDKAFDIVFSNSVIEHVGSRDAQQKFASEISRVGRSYWVQTPNRKFPIELHFMMPLLHYLPKEWQRQIISRFSVWELLMKPDDAQRAFYIDHFLRDIRLLDRNELQALLPDAIILSEKLFGFTKSLIAVRV